MDWERVESAPNGGARVMLAIPWFAICFVLFAWMAAPAFTEPSFGGPRVQPAGVLGIPFSAVELVGALGFVIGYVWMWKLYRAPTRFEGAHWRFHDN